MKIIASQNLGELGSTDGAPVFYRYVPPSMIPGLLPWIGLLMLLTAKPNRSWRAWWVWAPLAGTYGIAYGLHGMDVMPNELLDLFIAYAIGSAALWLIAPFFRQQHRFIVFLLVFATLGLYSAFSLFVTQDGDDMLIPLVIGISALVGITSIAVCVAGFHCRRAYRPFRFCLWLILWLVVGWLVLIVPFGIIAAVATGEDILPKIAAVPAVTAGISFVLLLPFLILFFTNAFFGERFQRTLQLSGSEVKLPDMPPVLPPDPGGDQEAKPE